MYFVNYYVTRFSWLIKMQKQIFSRAAEVGVIWLGVPAESHRRLFSDAKITLSTMHNSFEALYALESMRASGEKLPVILVDNCVAQRDRDCLAVTARQLPEFDDVYIVLFGETASNSRTTFYNDVISTTRELIKGSDVLIAQQSLFGKAIPDGVNASGRVLLIESNSTRRIIAKGLFKSLSIDHEIISDLNHAEAVNDFGVVFIASDMVNHPDASRLISQAIRVVVMGDVTIEGYESTPAPLREKDIVMLLRSGISNTQSKSQQAINVDDEDDRNLDGFTIDFEDIQTRLGVSDDIVQLVLATYLGDLDKQINSLNEAIDQAIPKSLKSVAHLIKGASSTMGVHELSAFAAKLEKQVANELDQPKVCLTSLDMAERLAKAIVSVKQALSVYLSKEPVSG